MKKFISVVLLFLSLFMLVSCTGKDEEKIDYFTVHYETNGGTLEENEKQTRIGNACILLTPSKDYSYFKGWYLDTTFNDGPYDEITKDEVCTVNVYAKWIELDQESYDNVNNINNFIKTIPSTIDLSTVSLEADVNKYYEAYNKLNEEQKTLINNAKTLINAYDAIKVIKGSSEKISEVINLIDELNSFDVAYFCIDKLDVIKGKIASFSEDELALVTNIKTYEKKLEEASKQTKSLANTIDLIDRISDPVTLDDKSNIVAAKSAYNRLDESLQSLVTNYDKLTKAEEDYDKLYEEEQKYEELATEVINSIAAIRYVLRLDDEEEIINVRKAYENLSEKAKSLVYNYNLLPMAEERMKKVKENQAQVTYMLGDDYYFSRNELRDSVFGDFFIFIYSKKNGLTDLTRASAKSNRKYDLTNPEEFIKACVDWEWDNGEQRGIGNSFSSYLLKIDKNGFLEDQPESTYLGYCYKNNRNVEFFKFFIRFFAYWRIDEQYAVQGTSLADTFAESWSPTVDMCKFFHFYDPITDTELPEFYYTDRLVDCFNKAAEVVYGDLPTTFEDTLTLPTSQTIYERDHNFVGWYLNKECTGDAVTTLTDNTKNYVLYAKWEENTTQREIDDALTVDVYLWNINSIYSSIHAQETLDMYNALSEQAKTYIVNTEYLENLKSKLSNK